MMINYNKLWLNWAKLSSSWDLTLLQFSVHLVRYNLFVGFCFVGFIEKIWLSMLGSVYLVHYISNILLGRFNFVDLFW